MSTLVSVIIPFFNEEQYLFRALDSVVKQSYEPIEIILVNDGSTDNSLSIAEHFRSKYAQIKLISTENKGLGHARNIGMTMVNGKYLTFLDSDDELEECAIGTWVKKMEEEQADIVIGRFNMVNIRNEDNKMLSGWKGEGKPGSGDDGIKAMYEYRMSSTAWGKLYRSDLAKQIAFPEGLWFEDRPFLFTYFLLAKHIVYEKSSQLNILSRQHSITRSLISERRIKDAYDIYKVELNIAGTHHNHKELMRFIDRHQINAIIEALIIFYYDRKAHPDMLKIKECFSVYVHSFISQLKDNGTRIGLRDRADLTLIRLHKFIGWSMTFFVLPFWKRKKCISVFKLKSF